MFDTLIDSRPKRHPRRYFGVGVFSLVAHTTIIGGVVIATLNAGQSDHKVRAEPSVYVVLQQEKPSAQEQLDDPLQHRPTFVVPPVVSIGIPSIDVTEKIDVQRYLGSGVEDSTANAMVLSNDVFIESIVEDKPRLLSAPPPPYPELLRQAGIEGRVLIEAVIDTAGRAEPGSVEIKASADAGFDQPSRTWIQHALFRPARVHGRAVRVLVQVPLDYRIIGR